MSDTLRTATIRLAYANPELRPHLLPLLAKEAADSDKVRAVNQDGKTVWVKKDTLRDNPGKFKPVKEEKGEKKEKGAPADSSKPKELPDMLRSLREEHEIPNIGDDPVSAIRAINRFMEGPSFKNQGYEDWEKDLKSVKSELAKHIPKKTKKTKTAPTRERVVTKQAATDPAQVARSAYKYHERDFKSLRGRIADMKKDSSFNSLKAKRDLNDLIEALDMLAKAKSVEDYADRAQEVEAACGKVLAKSKTDGLDDLMPLVKDAQKGAKAVAAKAGE